MFARRGHGTGRCRPCAGTVEVARHVATRASRPRCTQASAGPHAACSRVPLAPHVEHFIGPDMRHVHARDLRPEGKRHCGIVQCGGIGWSDHVAGSGAPHQMKRIRACACDSWRRMGSWTCDRGLANPRGSNGRPKTCSRWRPRTPPATRVRVGVSNTVVHWRVGSRRTIYIDGCLGDAHSPIVKSPHHGLRFGQEHEPVNHLPLFGHRAALD